MCVSLLKETTLKSSETSFYNEFRPPFELSYKFFPLLENTNISLNSIDINFGIPDEFEC